MSDIDTASFWLGAHSTVCVSNTLMGIALLTADRPGAALIVSAMGTLCGVVAWANFRRIQKRGEAA